MASITMASITMASTISNKATSLEASLSLPQTRISLSTLLKHRAAVSSSANTSAPLELSTVLAQSHPQQSVFCWPASPRHSLAWGHCSSAPSCSLALAPQVLHSCAFAHVSPSLQCLPLARADYSCSFDRVFPCLWLLG